MFQVVSEGFCDFCPSLLPTFVGIQLVLRRFCIDFWFPYRLFNHPFLCVFNRENLDFTLVKNYNYGR